MIINGVKHFTHVPLHFEYGALECVTTEEYRYYVSPEGKRYPSITTCLSEQKKELLEGWRRKLGEEEASRVTQKACGRGTSVHEVIEDYIQNKPLNFISPWIQENFEQVRPVIDKSLHNIFAVEQNMYSDYLGCSGTSDVVAEWDGVPSIIDWKTSAKEKNQDIIHSYFKQGAFYSMALEERLKFKCEQIVIVVACDDSPEPLIFKQHRSDWINPCIDAIRSYVNMYPDRFDKGRIM